MYLDAQVEGLHARIYELLTEGREDLLGPNTRLLSQIHSNEDNTFIDNQPPGFDVRGYYVPEGADSSYVRGARSNRRIFEGRGGLIEPGTLSVSDSPSSLAHELMHRLQDVRPAVPDEQFRTTMTALLDEIGGELPEGFEWEDFLRNPAAGARTEMIPHMLNGFRGTPDRLLEPFGIDRELLREEEESGERRFRRIARVTRAEIERLYLESLTEAELERASVVFGLNTGRGRATFN